MKKAIVFILVAAAVAVDSVPVDTIHENAAPDGLSSKIDTDYVYRVGRDAMKSDLVGEELHNMFKLEELMDCYKKHGLDAGNLPNVDDIDNAGKIAIFKSCNHLFNVPIIALKSKHLDSKQEMQQDVRLNHKLEKRSESRSGRTFTTKRTKMTKTSVANAYPPTMYAPTGSASQPIEVRVSFDGINIVTEVLRLQFLFLNTFFTSLSGCIETEDIETSMCLLDSFASAFSVLSIELGSLD